MIKKILILIAGSLTAISTLTGGAFAADKPLVFAIVPKGINDPFFADVEKGAREEAKKYNAQILYTGSTQSDESEQVQILRDLLTRGVTGIALSPVNADAVMGVIASAAGKHIPVVTFDSDAPDSKRLAYIGTNNLAAGEEAGKAFKSHLAKGKIAVITGHLAAANHGERVKGFHNIVNGSDYQEVPGSPFPCDDDVAKSIQIIQDTLTRYPDLNGFFFSGGWSTFGAPEAYKNAMAKKKADIASNKFVVVSFDTLPQQLEVLKDGYLTALIGQRPFKMGVQSIDALKAATEGKPVQNEDTGVDVVTAENVDQFTAKKP
jgi:ribose transport system substrate-binding protein